MEINVQSLLQELENGTSPDELAKSIETALNAAINQKAEKDAAASKAKLQEQQKLDAAEQVICSLLDYFEVAYPDDTILFNELDNFTPEEFVETLDGIYKLTKTLGEVADVFGDAATSIIDETLGLVSKKPTIQKEEEKKPAATASKAEKVSNLDTIIQNFFKRNNIV